MERQIKDNVPDEACIRAHEMVEELNMEALRRRDWSEDDETVRRQVRELGYSLRSRPNYAGFRTYYIVRMKGR